jgi:hypothetical protein
LSDAQTFNPNSRQEPTPPLRQFAPTSSGLTTIYDSKRQTPTQYFQNNNNNNNNENGVKFQGSERSLTPPVNRQPTDISYPRPFQSNFSPVPTASTPCSIPAFSPTPFMHPSAQSSSMKSNNEFFVVPLEPANLIKPIMVYDEETELRPSTADIIAQQSQDYIDEKLAEYQATITMLQGNVFFKTKRYF